MLNIYDVMVRFIRDERGLLTLIARRDAKLADEMRRAMSSVVLNLAEGSYSRGKNRFVSYHRSMGSAREVLGCLELAEAFGYVGPIASTRLEPVHQVIGTLVNILRPARSGT